MPLDRPAVTLLFARSRSPVSLAIRLFTWSRWSHVAVLHNGHVYESQAPGGVAVTPAHRWQRCYTSVQHVRLAHPHPADVSAFMASQRGKPYDYGAIAGLVFRRRAWADRRRWFCSELVAWAFAQAGRPLFRRTALSRITPQHLWMLAPVVASRNRSSTTCAARADTPAS